MSEYIAADECKNCDDEGELLKGISHTTLKNGDTIWRCPRCGAMWGMNKDGERLDGRIP